MRARSVSEDATFHRPARRPPPKLRGSIQRDPVLCPPPALHLRPGLCHFRALSDEVHELLRSPLHTASEGWAFIPHLAPQQLAQQQHISLAFPNGCLLHEPYADLASHQGAQQQHNPLLNPNRCRPRETYERRGLYLRAVPTRAALTARRSDIYATAVCTYEEPTACPNRWLPRETYEPRGLYLRAARIRATLTTRRSDIYVTAACTD